MSTSVATKQDAGRRGPGRVVRDTVLFGPAFVAAVAYVDPGNFATNFHAGARYGYQLVWVVVAATVAATFIQYLSAKLGLVTGKGLPLLCRENMRTVPRIGMWLQAEAVAIATDLAEFVGAAIGLNLLFGMPLPIAAVVTAIVSFILLGIQSRGPRTFEVVIAFFVLMIAAGFAYLLVAADSVSSTGVASGLVPRLADEQATTLAVGILGATVMPHVIYVHSALTAQRAGWGMKATPRALRVLRLDTVLGLSIAGTINMSMLCIAAAVFHGKVGFDPSLAGIHEGMGRWVGGAAALVFAAVLLSSGLSSSGVGTYAGQIIMDGLLRRRIPLALRRAITMAPALAIFVIGVSPDDALLVSQIVLSFGIPFALVPLTIFTARRRLMGDFVNRRTTTVMAVLITALVAGLNALLLVQLF